MGRPRKPLWPPGHRGFESHRFRHQVPDRLTGSGTTRVTRADRPGSFAISRENPGPLLPPLLPTPLADSEPMHGCDGCDGSAPSYRQTRPRLCTQSCEPVTSVTPVSRAPFDRPSGPGLAHPTSASRPHPARPDLSDRVGPGPAGRSMFRPAPTSLDQHHPRDGRAMTAASLGVIRVSNSWIHTAGRSRAAHAEPSRPRLASAVRQPGRGPTGAGYWKGHPAVRHRLG
jgi:hypothetical protein